MRLIDELTPTGSARNRCFTTRCEKKGPDQSRVLRRQPVRDDPALSGAGEALLKAHQEAGASSLHLQSGRMTRHGHAAQLAAAEAPWSPGTRVGPRYKPCR
jgi:hypothetical protein